MNNNREHEIAQESEKKLFIRLFEIIVKTHADKEYFIMDSDTFVSHLCRINKSTLQKNLEELISLVNNGKSPYYSIIDSKSINFFIERRHQTIVICQFFLSVIDQQHQYKPEVVINRHTIRTPASPPNSIDEHILLNSMYHTLMQFGKEYFARTTEIGKDEFNDEDIWVGEKLKDLQNFITQGVRNFILNPDNYKPDKKSRLRNKLDYHILKASSAKERLFESLLELDPASIAGIISNLKSLVNYYDKNPDKIIETDILFMAEMLTMLQEIYKRLVEIDLHVTINGENLNLSIPDPISLYYQINYFLTSNGITGDDKNAIQLNISANQSNLIIQLIEYRIELNTLISTFNSLSDYFTRQTTDRAKSRFWERK